MCDSIFLDYHWSLDRLHRSRSFAGDRAVDVYVGVDVFGRDRFYGGGGFNCDVVNQMEYALVFDSIWECFLGSEGYQ